MAVRTLFLLLVLANAVFYAYAYVARERETARRAGPELQINADRIRIVRHPDAASAAPAPAACLEWGVLTGSDVARASEALAQLALPDAIIQRTVTDAPGYWVYMPPLKAQPAIDKKLEELRALGVTDARVVQEPAQWRTAISFGTFRTEQTAVSFLEGLKAKGVRTAIMGRREDLLKQAVYYLREPASEIVARIAELKQAFPGTEIKAGQCPAP